MSNDSMNADGRKLKSLVDDLNERIRALKLFDRAGEINTHCDELVGQVTLAVESGIAHLNKLQADMIAEINSYRAELLVREPPPPPRQIPAAIGQKEPGKLERKLETLVKEVEAFSVQCSTNSEDWSKLTSQARWLSKRTRQLRREMRAQAFASGFMWLMRSDSPQNGLVGRLERIQKDTEDDISARHIVLNDCVSQASAFELDPDTPVGFKHALTAMLFLRDGNIAIALERRPIVVWKPTTSQRIFELKKLNHHPESFTALVQTSDQFLISGEQRGSIDIWNLVSRCHSRSLSPMAGPVLSLDWLPDEGKLIGFNGSVFIWNFDPADNRRYGLVRFNHPVYDYSGEKIIKQTTNGFKLYEDIRTWNVNKQRKRSCLSKHQPLYKLSYENEARVHLEVNFRVLSNGFFVFCYVVPSGATVQVWDPLQDALVNDYEFPGDDVESCAILPSGDAVVCRLDQQVQLYSLLDGKLYRSFRNDKGSIVAISQHSSNSITFFHVRDESGNPNRFGSQQSASNSFHVCFSTSEDHLALVNNKTKKLAIWSLRKFN